MASSLRHENDRARRRARVALATAACVGSLAALAASDPADTRAGSCQTRAWAALLSWGGSGCR